MKILCLCSTLDFTYRYGCTPAWWQFLKGLYELGHEVIAIPYQGYAIESPWWRVYPNPCEWEGNAFAVVKKLIPRGAGRGTDSGLVRQVVHHWIRPRWEKHVARVLDLEQDVSAVLVLTIPINHFTGLPSRLRRRFGVPFFYYDGDTPASLPRFGGFASGFRIYEDADLGEYDGVLCNSEGGATELLEMGARRVETVHWGVDPDLYAPVDVEPDRDVFFYGFGIEFRERWIEAMLAEPSRALPGNTFAVGGKGFPRDLGRTAQVGNVPFSAFRQACCRSRINLNITRDAHASVYASSSMRPFELAAMGCCVVSNPYAGLETWFALGSEMLVVDSAKDAIDVYARLLGDDGSRKELGAAARRRVLECHTHRHRAQQIARFIDR